MNPDASPRIWTAANVLTALRLILTFPVTYAILNEPFGPASPALLLFLVAACTDSLDGIVARARGEITKLGTLLDPIADKIFGSVTFGALALGGYLPWALLVALVVKELALLIGGAFLLRRRGLVISARSLGKLATFVMSVGFGVIVGGFEDVGARIATTGVVLSLAAGVDYALQVVRGRATG